MLNPIARQKIKLASRLCLFIGLWMTYSVTKADETSAEIINVSAYQSFQQGNYQKSYLLAKQAKQLAIEESNPQELARALSNIANNILYFGDTENALPLYLESLSVAKKNEDLEGVERAINNISAFYVHIGNSHEAVSYLQKLPVINGIKRPILSQLRTYQALAGRYAEIGELIQAKKAQLESERLIVIAPNDFFNTYILQNKAIILSAEKKHQEAIKKYKIS